MTRQRAAPRQGDVDIEANFKAHVALAALRGERTVFDLARILGVEPHKISLWKDHLEEHAHLLFVQGVGIRPEQSASSQPADYPVPATVGTLSSLRRLWNLVLRSYREWQHAARVSADLLLLYRNAANQRPAASRQALYRAVLIEYFNGSVEVAEEMLTRAEQSFATWPVERELRFQDVVHYVAVVRWLATHPAETGTQTRMSESVKRRIPREL